MRLPPFQYVEPESMEEALSLLSTRTETVKIMAGGTDLLNRMKLRLTEPACVMSISRLQDLDGIRTGEAETVIGANTRLKEIACAPTINQKFRAVAEAAFQVASSAITNMATAGGNILQDTRCMYYNQSGMVLNGLERCHKRGGNVCLAVNGSKRCFSVYQGDMAPALIAFNARCVLERKGSMRTVSLTEIFTGDGTAPFALGADELLTKIILPNPEGMWSSAYRKLRLRGSTDYPLISAAAFVSGREDRRLTRCRLAIGAAGTAPKVVDRPSPEVDAETIAQKAYDLVEGADTLQMPGAYRRKMARVLARRAIGGAIDGLKEGM